jgi:hypothetical protein
MTTKKPKLKRILAREILFFFTGLLLIGIVWGFLLMRNSYYENKASSCNDKIKTLQLQIDSLPKDYIKEFYDQTSRYFVVNYKLGQDSYAIPKEQEKAFLYDDLGIKRKATLMPGNPKGHSCFKQADPLNIHGNDSSLVFDYVTMEKFREYVTSDDYQDKLYTVFANNSGNDEWVPPLDAVRAEFDPMKPYNGIFQLGTLSDFKTKMKIGLKFNSTVVEHKTKITDDIADLKETISNSNYSKLNSNEVKQFVINSAFVVGLLLYILRLSIVLIVWAIKTVKQND